MIGAHRIIVAAGEGRDDRGNEEEWSAGFQTQDAAHSGTAVLSYSSCTPYFAGTVPAGPNHNIMSVKYLQSLSVTPN